MTNYVSLDDLLNSIFGYAPDYRKQTPAHAYTSSPITSPR